MEKKTALQSFDEAIAWYYKTTVTPVDFALATGVEHIDRVPFNTSQDEFLFIMADGYYLDDYEENAKVYGINRNGLWVAVEDGHCSCYGWEATSGDCTTYDSLELLVKSDPDAVIVLKHWATLLVAYPFLEPYTDQAAEAILWYVKNKGGA